MNDSDQTDPFDSILAAFLEAANSSSCKPSDVEEWIRRYPEYERQLRSYVLNLAQVEAVLGPRGALSPDADTLGRDIASPQVGSNPRYFGEYELINEIARGGMGVVYKARQTSLDRFVALKMLLSGQMATESDVVRFLAEAEAAANLDHPNIVPIYEIGEHEGQQYFTMKLISGVSLRHSNQAPLNQPDEKRQREIASLIAKVADAVQHAHERGILHRDLKPSNILIDSQGEPHVTDFGLAKKVVGDCDLTRTGAVLGTPAYMAPEQARGEKSLTTAADIYSLGAILYELLSGQAPFSGATPIEIILAVQQKEPVRPSSIFTAINRDLETITLKCMERNPTSRYRSAADVAAELQRWLKGLPIKARPIGKRERAIKWVRRNPAVASLLVLSLTMTSAVIVALAGLLHQAKLRVEESQRNLIAAQAATERQIILRREAQAAQEQAEAAQEIERQARIAEERERDYAAALTEFVVDDFLALTSVEGQERFGAEVLDRDTTLYHLLERAALKLASRTDLDPRIEAELSWIIGINYRGAGEAAKGIPFLERSAELQSVLFGPDSTETLNTMNSLAICYSAVGREEEGVRLLENVLEKRKKVLGVDHIFTLRTMNALSVGYRSLGDLEKARKLQEETLSRRRATLGPKDPDTLTSMNNLARIYKSEGLLKEAIGLYETTLELRQDVLGAEHLHTLETVNHLASSYEMNNAPRRALPLYERVLEARKRLLESNHPDVLISMNNLAGCLRKLGRLDEAILLHEQTYDFAQEKLGPNHPHTLLYLSNLAAAFWSAGRFDRSVPAFEKLLTLQLSMFGRSHRETVATLANLGLNYVDAGQLEDGYKLLEEVCESVDQYPELRWVRRRLRDQYIAAKQVDSFRKLMGKDIAFTRLHLPPQSPSIAGELLIAGHGFVQLDCFDEATDLLREALAIQRQQPSTTWVSFWTQALLGEALLGKARLTIDSIEKAQLHAEAETLLLNAHKGMKERKDVMPPQAESLINEPLDRLLEHYRQQGQFDLVEKYSQNRDTAEPKN